MGKLPPRPGGETRSSARLGNDSADHLVNTTRRLVNNHDPSTRPVHGQGVVATGTFTASGAIADLTSNPQLAIGTSKATVRLSCFRRDSWDPKPDIRGFACRLVAVEEGEPNPDPNPLQPPQPAAEGHGLELDLVGMTPPRFFVRREEDFHQLKLNPRAILMLLLTRRTTFTAMGNLIWFTKIRPKRYLHRERFWGVHTFFTSKEADKRAVRYHWRPVVPEPLPQQPPDQDLALNLKERLDNGMVVFDLVVDLFDEPVPYRKTNDALRRYPSLLREIWPISKRNRWEGTQRRIAGRLTLDTYHPPGTHPAYDEWVFNPVPRVPGFEASDDEVLQARGSSYPASQAGRRAHP